MLKKKKKSKILKSYKIAYNVANQCCLVICYSGSLCSHLHICPSSKMSLVRFLCIRKDAKESKWFLFFFFFVFYQTNFEISFIYNVLLP